MDSSDQILVTDTNGRRGRLMKISEDGRAIVRLDTGPEVHFKVAELRPHVNGFATSFPFDSIEEAQPAPRIDDGVAPLVPDESTARVAAPLQTRNDDVVIPIVQEQLRVDRERVETGAVRITKSVSEREEVIDLPFTREEVQVERVQINEVVTTAPPIRYEGDTMIIPLVEEVLVVERRLLLREEVRVSKVSEVRQEPQRVPLKVEELSVERVPLGETSSINTGS
jgi:uncharacterized protein (TIGR02271 family)